MFIPDYYMPTLMKLKEIAGPIIQYRIDKELLNIKDCSIEDYIEQKDERISYWYKTLIKNKIHGKDDSFFENSIAKLLEYGYTNTNSLFNDTFKEYLSYPYWDNELWKKIVIYPFMVRAGFVDTEPVKSFFIQRLESLEKTIHEIFYDFKESSLPKQKKYSDKYIFRTDFIEHPLPSIYDIYAFSFYPERETGITERIENIIKYVIDDRFQSIPDSAYVYDKKKKQYYAAGSIYHACFRNERKLLNIYLFSHFSSISKSSFLINQIKELLSTQNIEGFFDFDKELLKEVKNQYYIYSGAHMGLGENKSKKNSRLTESTFWMLKILSNLYKNKIAISKE